MPRPSPARWSTAFVVLGLGLRAYHYGKCPSVWHDEAALVVNVLRLSFAELLGPLVHAEAAPPLFLWLERAAVFLFGDGEYALRLVPFLASCLALLLFPGLARRSLGPTAATLAVGLFAVSDRLLWHATEAKSYAVDVLVAVAAAWWCVRTRGWGLSARCLPAAVVAPVALWLSYPACFVAGGLLVALLPAVVRRDANWAGRLAYAALAGSVGVAFVCLATGPAAAQRCGPMDDCWVPYFPPWDRPWRVPLWAVVGTFEVARYCLLPLGQVLAVFAGVGAVSLWRRGESGRPVLAVVLLPLGLALVAAFLNRYPYGGTRLEVFAAPGVCLLVAEGARRAVPYLARRSRLVAGVGALLVAVPFGNAAFRVVVDWPREDCQGAAGLVARSVEPGDVVFANHWEYEYYFRNVPWSDWDRADLPTALAGAKGAWVAYSSRPAAETLSRPLPPGWAVRQSWPFEDARVFRLERVAPAGQPTYSPPR